MFIQIYRSVLMVSVLTGLLVGAEEGKQSLVATVSSAEAFEMGGVTVQPRGVTSWPLPAGSEVKSMEAPVTVKFKDGSVVVVGSKSRLRVERDSEGLAVRLLSGVMEMTPAVATRMRFFNDKQAVQSAAGVATTVSTTRIAGAGNQPITPSIVKKAPVPISIR